MTFSHPLARHVTVGTTNGVSKRPRKILVIMTTLELDPGSKKFKADKVKILSDAAEEWVEANVSEATDFMLINRAKDWPA